MRLLHPPLCSWPRRSVLSSAPNLYPEGHEPWFSPPRHDATPHDTHDRRWAARVGRRAWDEGVCKQLQRSKVVDRSKRPCWAGLDPSCTERGRGLARVKEGGGPGKGRRRIRGGSGLGRVAGVWRGGARGRGARWGCQSSHRLAAHAAGYPFVDWDLRCPQSTLPSDALEPAGYSCPVVMSPADPPAGRRPIRVLAIRRGQPTPPSAPFLAGLDPPCFACLPPTQCPMCP